MIDLRKQTALSFLLVVSAVGCVAAGAPPASDPFAGANELSANVLVEQVVARNPTLTQMTAAAAAAAARYPQAISLEDPMFGATISPRLFGSHESEDGYRVELSQKYPWPGKLCLRGKNAAAEARAAGHDIDDTRLQLIESARNAFADYYLAERGLVVSQESLRLLNEFHRNAETLFTTGKVPQQDLLQAEVEIGKQRQRQLTLERMRQVPARINTLLHLLPDGPLPPPPTDIPTGAGCRTSRRCAASPWRVGPTFRQWPTISRRIGPLSVWPTRSITPTSRPWRLTTSFGRNGNCGPKSACA